MREVKAYLANQFGFSQTGDYILNNLIIPRIQKIGFKVNDSFLECGKHYDGVYVNSLESHQGRINYLKEFNTKIGIINDRLMQESDCLAAILDGGHIVDDGVASEIGYYTGIKRGPIFALRSDFRCGENMAVSINPQILGYILQSGGKLIDGELSLGRFFEELERFYHSLINQR